MIYDINKVAEICDDMLSRYAELVRNKITADQRATYSKIKRAFEDTDITDASRQVVAESIVLGAVVNAHRYAQQKLENQYPNIEN